MSTNYTPTDTIHSVIVIPSDGDAASASFFDPPYQQVADNAQVAMNRHTLITVATLQALTGMADGTARSLIDGSGFPLGTFYYRSALSKVGFPWGVPVVQAASRIFFVPSGADTGVWVHESVGQGDDALLMSVGSGVSSTLLGSDFTQSASSGQLVLAQSAGVTGSPVYVNASSAMRRGALESVTVVWKPNNGRGAVPAVNPFILSLNVYSSSGVGTGVPFAGSGFFGPNTLGGWNANVIRADTVAVNPGYANFTSSGFAGASIRIVGENGANSITGDIFYGFAFNYRRTVANGAS